MKDSTKQSLVGKDFINIGVYTVLLMVATFVVSIPFMPFMAVTYPLMAGVCALFSAPIFMLMNYKVAKRWNIVAVYSCVWNYLHIHGIRYCVSNSASLRLIV